MEEYFERYGEEGERIMSRIIVDLTEFATWSGHQTGVQRVVYGLARGLDETVKGVKFISFVGGSDFKEVDFEDFVNSLAYVEPVASSANVQAAKTLLKKVYQKSPNFVQQYLTPSRKEAIKRKAKLTRNNLRNLKNIKIKTIVKQKAVTFEFKSGDIILSAGRAWDDNSYIDALENIKLRFNAKLVYAFYDLTPIYQQHTFGAGLTGRYSRYLYRILHNSDYIFPISESSKKDLLKYASEIGILSLPRIETIRLGDDISGTTSEIPPYFVRNPESFAISVGTIEARKNHTEIYYAYRLAYEQGIELPDIYIIGKPGWLTGDIIYFIQNDVAIKDKITIISNVNDRDLAWLYKNALYTVYPSEYEGWGLPIAESLAYGTPVIASHTSSMIEISPELVDHISPFDPGQLLGRMKYYTNPKNSYKKRQEIENGYKLYSWNKTVKTLLDTFK